MSVEYKAAIACSASTLLLILQPDAAVTSDLLSSPTPDKAKPQLLQPRDADDASSQVVPFDGEKAWSARAPSASSSAAGGDSGPPLTLAAQATGGDQAGTSLQTEYERAYDAMLADLSDPEKSFRFAELAVRVGDINGAINALERILLLNPALDNIRLELGLLYHRVGNAAVASA